MSLTLNMVGGGGGGLKATDALLRVQAPAGSTVTISKGTTTKTDLGHENADDNTVYDYYFIIHQSQFDSVNPWTVTATLSGDTASDTIIIDTADEYDLILNYILYVVKDGTLQSGITFTAKNGSAEQQTGFYRYMSSGNTGSVAYASIPNFSKYSSITFELYDSSGQCYNLASNVPSFGVSTNVPTVDAGSGTVSGYTAYKKMSIGENSYITKATYTLDISSAASTAQYLAMGVCGTASFSGSLRIKNFYLSP